MRKELEGYRELEWGWWLAAGVQFGLFAGVRLTRFFVLHDPWWMVPIWLVTYGLLSLQLLGIGRRRRLDAEIRRLQLERARLMAALSLVTPVVAKMASEREAR